MVTRFIEYKGRIFFLSGNFLSHNIINKQGTKAKNEKTRFAAVTKCDIPIIFLIFVVRLRLMSNQKTEI